MAPAVANKNEVTGETMIILQGLRLWRKLASGDMHQVTKKDVEELFDVLDPEEKGQIDVNDLMTLQYVDNLNISAGDLAALATDADKDCDSKITLDELFKALTTGTVAFNLVKEHLGKKQVEVKHGECTRADLLEWMTVEHETASALWSLPGIILLFAFFVLFSTTHVNVSSNFQMATAQKGNVRSTSGIFNGDSFMTWVETKWPDLYFRQDLLRDPNPGRVASFQQMMGGVRMQKTFHEAGPCATSTELSEFYNPSGLCLGAPQALNVIYPYHLNKSIIISSIQNLSKTVFFDQNTSSVELQTILLNAHLNVFTWERLVFLRENSGTFRTKFIWESWTAEPYREPSSYVPDALFVILILRMLFSELKELIPAISSGLDGIVDYLQFWNIVDWFTIFGGMFCVAFWFYFVILATVTLPAAIKALPQRALDADIYDSGSYLSYDRINEIVPIEDLESAINNMMDVARATANTHVLIRACFFAYLFVLMLKFFKGFRANPRLDVVIQTLSACSVNVAHFFIVFFAIFSCYAFSGHVLFGHSVPGYNTLLGALFTCWRGGISASDIQDFEIPLQVLGYTWTLTYQMLISMIILNMLLSIVFDAYYRVKAKLVNPQTIWAQTRHAFRTLAETRTHMPLYPLITQFEDDDYPAHPGQVVTGRSLKRAFEKDKMTRQNAEYLVRKTQEYVVKREGVVGLTLTDAIRIIGQVKNTTLKNLDVTEQCLEIFQKDANLDTSQQVERQLAMTRNMTRSRAKTAELATPSHSKVAVAPSGIPGQVDEDEERPGPKEGDRGGGGISKETAEQLMASMEQISNFIQASRADQARLAQSVEDQLKEEWQAEVKRTGWFMHQITELDMRLQRIERCIGQLGPCFTGINFSLLSEVPDQLEHEIMTTFGSRSELEAAGCAPSRIAQLDKKLKAISDQVLALSDKADDGSQAHAILWNLEMNLRKLNDGVPVVPSSVFRNDHGRPPQGRRPAN